MSDFLGLLRDNVNNGSGLMLEPAAWSVGALANAIDGLCVLPN